MPLLKEMLFSCVLFCLRATLKLACFSKLLDLISSAFHTIGPLKETVPSKFSVLSFVFEEQAFALSLSEFRTW